MSTRAVITGGEGFIGTALARELLEHGYRVAIFGRVKPSAPICEYTIGDIRNRKILRQAVRSADIVYHLAGVLGTEYLVDHYHKAVDVNIHGSLNVFGLARRYNFRVVNLGLLPDWPTSYMITKKAAAKFGVMFANEFDTDVCTVELSHVYGPGQRVTPYYKAIPTFISNALHGRRITVYGRGMREMDCLYVEDAVRGIRLLGECSDILGRVLQFGSGQSVAVAALARKIVELVGSDSSIALSDMRRGEPTDAVDEDPTAVDLTEWRKLVRWQPEWSLTDGLQQTIEWQRNRVTKETQPDERYLMQLQDYNEKEH